MWSPIPFSFFIENNISTNDCLPRIRIVELVAFRIGVITDEDVLLTFVIQLASFLIRYMYIAMLPNT